VTLHSIAPVWPDSADSHPNAGLDPAMHPRQSSCSLRWINWSSPGS